ncbi:hypothetical protein [Halobacteriovorax sp. ZH2_bin.1]|uniref:hypothetical protein n=1 Tax=Halobacteriovorax sp. ZH2_bin.1 TaxID=3157724 RepID=UPI003716F493
MSYTLRALIDRNGNIDVRHLPAWAIHLRGADAIAYENSGNPFADALVGTIKKGERRIPITEGVVCLKFMASEVLKKEFNNIADNITPDYSITESKAVAGDQICYVQDIYSGRWPQKIKQGQELVEAKVIKYSVSERTGKTSYTLNINGKKKVITEAVLHRYSIRRKEWGDEEKRETLKGDMIKEQEAVRNWM